MLSADEFSSGPDCVTWVIFLLLWSLLSYLILSSLLLSSLVSSLLSVISVGIFRPHEIYGTLYMYTVPSYTRCSCWPDVSTWSLKGGFYIYYNENWPKWTISDVFLRGRFLATFLIFVLDPLVALPQCCTANHCLNPQNKTAGVFPSDVMLQELKKKSLFLGIMYSIRVWFTVL